MIRKGPHRIAHAVWLASRGYASYQGVKQSAALAFYSLLSFIPMGFLVLAVAGAVWDDPEAVSGFIRKQLTFLVPWFQAELVNHIMHLARLSKGLGWMSVGFVIWTSGLYFSVLQSSLLLPWTREHEHRTGIWRLALPWVLGPAMGVLLCGGMLFMHLVSYVNWTWLPFTIFPGFWTWLLVSFSIFFFYKLLLPIRVNTGLEAVVSLGISGMSYGLTKIFASILLSLPNYSLVYGSLAGIVLFMLWLNYNMAVIIWGSHFIRVLVNQDDIARAVAERKASAQTDGRPDNDEREELFAQDGTEDAAHQAGADAAADGPDSALGE